MFVIVCFFFKQKTAYERRIRDWSSDVCSSDLSFTVAAAPLGLTVLAVLGLGGATLPYGLPGRRLAWLLMAPALCWLPKRPLHGDWTLHALDVGQASAIVIQTASHTFLFDTGLRSSPTSDSGARIIWPFLRSQGISKIGRANV